ncbi:MAG TPA: LysR substrate-binding domain-containing protein [Microbacterium sp.]|uniref:LysR substrate-binding domain-containing protein n=1 Tax=Microbacterium sp. TaxID=51671 RepID=UPI002B499758|nr:LysR substrate-binding domain-containing protein [Microbacterium sp.]HKT55343.1 LysR substrate-binding domain-containing protein [Microbacterium sp.]
MNDVARPFELRRLRLLHEFAQRGTIAEVAAATSYSPSTVSQQLDILAREAGTALLERDGRRVRLTEAGRTLARHAARMLELDEAAHAELAASRGAPTVVRIAVMPTAAQALVPRALGLLDEREPTLRLESVEMSPEEGLRELATRAFDLVVAEQYPGHAREFREGFDRVLLGPDPVRLAIGPDDPARDIAELADRPWILEPRGTAVRDWAVQQCRAAGFDPDVRFEGTDLTTHIRMAAAGRAVAMLPDMVWTGDRATVRLIDLPGAPVREIFAAVRTSSRDSRAITAVQTALRDALAAHRPR